MTITECICCCKVDISSVDGLEATGVQTAGDGEALRLALWCEVARVQTELDGGLCVVEVEAGVEGGRRGAGGAAGREVFVGALLVVAGGREQRLHNLVRVECAACQRWVIAVQTKNSITKYSTDCFELCNWHYQLK